MIIEKQISLANAILGAIVITLIALPMSVFAQNTSADATGESDTGDSVSIATTTEDTSESEVVPVSQAKTYYDTYKREELPSSNKSFNDFVVGPGRFALEIAPGESKTVMMNVSNRLGSKRLFRFSTEDMTTSAQGDSDTTVQLLGDEVGPYTIKDYITVQYDRFYIENDERAVIPVTVTIPPDAEPGGFYGSILTEVLPESSTDQDSDVAPSAALVSRIGTLFYVTTPGEIAREGSLIDFTTIPNKKVFLEGPIDMGIVFENTGSIHLTPYGEVKVTNLLGENVGTTEITPWFVMPKSIRTREISWDREFLFGRYVVTADIERGYGDTVDSLSLVFWVFPWKFLSVVFAGIFTFFLLLRFILRNFEFKRK